MSASEVFANQPFGTVTSGGTTPDTGSETWTVSANPAAPFPAASTGVSQFHVTDTDTTAASEIILVTNVSGTTWMVTRGAEGTTPVAHQPGFTITQVLTAGWLSGVVSGVNAVDNGGTGLVTAAAYALLTGGTTPTSPLQQVGSLGTSGQVLTSQGAGSLPGWTSQTGLVNPMSALGDMISGGSAGAAARLIGSTSASKRYLTQTGTGSASAAPAWGTIASADVPTLNQNTTGTAATAGNVTGIVAVLNGGTGGTSATTFAVVTGGTSATSPFQQVASVGTAGQALTSNGAGSLPSWQQTFTGLMEPLTSPVTSAGSPYSAAAGQYVPVDTTSGNVTVALPASPADKAIVGIKQVIQGGTFAVTYTATGGAVFNKTGGGTQGTLPLPSQGVIVQYASAGTIWYVYSDDLPLGQLDLRYVTQSSLPLGAGSGGTGLGSLSTFAIIAGGTASTTPVQQIAAGTSGQVLTGNGAGTLPSFQANIGFNNPMTVHGDIIFENAALAPAALPGNTTSTKNILTSTGSGGTANSPIWGTITAADVPTLNQNTTGTAANVTGTVATINGGTGLASLTTYAVITGGTSATAPHQQVSGVGTSGQVLTSAGAAALPAWQALPAAGASTGGTITLAGDLAGTPSSPQVTSTHLAAALPVTQGGIGGTQATAYAVVTGGTTSTAALQQVSGVGTAGQPLVSQGAAALPQWAPVSGQFLSTFRFAPTTATFFPVNSTTPAAFGPGTIGTQPFTAPPSGNVLITVNCVLVTTGGGVFVAMFLSPHGSATTVSSDIIQYESPSAGFAPQQGFPFMLSGLTPGTSYNYDLLGSATSAQAGTIIAFTQTTSPPLLGVTDRGGPVVVTVQAV